MDYVYALTYPRGVADMRPLLTGLMKHRGFTTHAELADLLGVSQPTVTRWFGGAEPQGQTRDEIVRRAAEAGLIDNFPTVGARLVPVVGRVGANPDGTILYGEGDLPSERAYAPSWMSAKAVAILVHGDSMGRLYMDGSLIFYENRRDPPTEDMLGETLIVGLENSEVLLKRLLRGSEPGLFDLESVHGAIRPDCRVMWAAEISAIVPPKKARQLRIPADPA